MSNKKNIIIILIIYNERISQPKKAQKQNWDGTFSNNYCYTKV